MSGARILALARYDIAVAARNGEQLLLILGIPVLILVFFASVDVLPTGDGEPVDFLAPGVLALAVMSTAMTNLAIAVGFDREYGFLRRLGTSPLRRIELVAAKVVVVLAQLAVQFAVLIPTALALGWDPSRTGIGTVLVAVVLASIGFGGVGMLLAGRLRGLVVLAAANALYLVLLLVGGLVISLDELPGVVADVARLLPPAALGDILRGVFVADDSVPGRAWLVLIAWAIASPLVAARLFRWHPGR